MKLFYFDLETTGVRYWKDGIHQISACIDINGKIEEWIDLKVRPNPKAEISDEALKVSGVTREEIAAYMPMEEGYRQLIAILSKYVNKFDKTDKMFLVGYNCASFDSPFLRAFFVQNGDDYFGSWFWSASLDVMCLAAQYLVTERIEMKDFKLGTVCSKMGIEVDALKQHDARYDVEIMRELHRRVIVPFVKQKVEKRSLPDTSERFRRVPGKIVQNGQGKVGRTYEGKEVVNGKVAVYFMKPVPAEQVPTKGKHLDMATMIARADWEPIAKLCAPSTLKTIGYID